MVLVIQVSSRSDCDGAIATPATAPLFISWPSPTKRSRCSFPGVVPLSFQTGRVAVSSPLRPRRGNLTLTCLLADAHTSKIASTPGTNLLPGPQLP